MQQCQVSCTHIVKIDLDIFPSDFSVVWIDEFKALRFVVNFMKLEYFLGCLIVAVVILSSKQIDAHDAEDKPEDETHQQHIHDGGNCTHQGVHHNLKSSEETEILHLSKPKYLHKDFYI